ncbi:type IX secretion system membrane protein PorP/SprF [Pontibacter qinzhouensis]|uniref:Type IX secretion system membrane protein PorP/SprF n=1 Tax=Pontibacter qinzhouensis TaxID=2603253 RepID=A0A5C8JH14_9BACT|nr:type IX secretion system membrane protein PorP/SprF [Pontibacter qinzhouensis]TXK37795.1 type IX secretion system membrane protein PorP/SprF [Pontibacter qinzhouensis]
MKLLYTLLALLLTFAASAQQNPQYSQYIFNSMAINPAYTGSKKVLNFNAFHRSQWTSIEGAPTTSSLLVDGLVANDKLGLGLDITRDKIGALTNTAAYANVAVRVPLSEQSTLSLGVAPGFKQRSLNGLELGIIDDPSIPTGNETSFRPDVKLGLYFNTNRFYAGVSAADLLNFEDDLELSTQRHYFFTTGYVFDLGSSLKFKPSVLIKEDFKAPANVDLNAFLLIKDILWLGGSYRTSMNLFNENPATDARNRTALALIGQIQISKAFRLGYGYDVMLNDFKGVSTHEISVGYYLFGKKNVPMLTPQYF